jgi:hypothetical protein
MEWGGGISARKIYGLTGPGPVEEGWEKNFKEKGLDAVPREAVQVWERETHSGHMLSLISSYRYGVFIILMTRMRVLQRVTLQL